MSDAAPNIEPDAKPSHSGLLLSLIRRLIDYGMELAATIKQRAATNPNHTRGCFGTTDLALILRCIARGLLRARALEARVLQWAACLDNPPRPRQMRHRATPPRAPGPRVDPGIPPLSPEAIAAEIRRRPIGAVLADICRDFGIPLSHPLMRELEAAIRKHGGSATRLLIDMFDRFCPLPPRRPPARLTGPALAPAGTGPP